MRRIVVGTSYVRMDEPCWSLSELNGPTPDSKGVHRYQIIKVMRGAPPPVEFRRDLGDAKNFTATEFCFPGGFMDPDTGRYYIEHTVGEWYDAAERVRNSHRFDPPEPPKPTDLIKLYHDQPDKSRRARKKLSVFGAQVKVQRD